MNVLIDLLRIKPPYSYGYSYGIVDGSEFAQMSTRRLIDAHTDLAIDSYQRWNAPDADVTFSIELENDKRLEQCEAELKRRLEL